MAARVPTSTWLHRWFPAALILAALAAFAGLAWSVRGDLAAVRAEIDADLLRPPAAEPTPAAPRAAPAGPTRTLPVVVTRVRSAAGVVRVLLYRGDPLTGAPFQRRTAPAATGDVRVVFEDLPPGDYAVTAFHDEDQDDALGRRPDGLPTEGVGASGGFGPRQGQPTFARCRFTLDERRKQLFVWLYYFR